MDAWTPGRLGAERDRVVHLNGGPFTPLAPFGGRKQSGTGREMGKAGIEEFTELKAILR